jgi:pilus retraction protein PilT
MTEANNQNQYSLTLDDLLREAVERKGSDLHLVAKMPPVIRISSDMVQTEHPVIQPSELQWLIESVLKPDQIETLHRDLELDFSYSLPSVARFRGNVIYQRGTLAAAIRVVPFKIPKLENLGLPADVIRLCDLPRGLVLVTGPTGSGKSTTLAAMIDFINEKYAENIITVEDPIEFLHPHKKSIVRQREIGIDTHSFAIALRQVLRHDPDVIMIGEMRDPESISIAITAAETGHLVFSTLHTQTAPLTISRIVDSFPSGQKEQIRQQLSNSLKAVISQQLIPAASGKGRALAVEYMIDTPAVRNLIREEKEHQLYSAIQTGQKLGMQTMDQALVSLIRTGKINYEGACEYCIDRAELDRLIKTSI